MAQRVIFHSSLVLAGRPLADRAAPDETAGRGLPLYLSPVEAGFPSPADDYIESLLDVHDYVVRNQAATFFLRAKGHSMQDAGIHDGDLLVVDRSLDAAPNAVVIAAVDGELTVKRLARRKGRLYLDPANPDYQPLDITDNESLHIWGVVSYVIHKL